MKIAVLIKQTPDTAELPKISANDAQSGNVQATMVINPWDEYAAEEAIDLSERFDGDSVAISLGPAEAVDALKHALAMGVGSALLIENADPTSGDDWTTAALLAAAIKSQGDVDIVLTGRQSVDGNSGSVFVGVARKLGYPLLVNVVEVVDVSDGAITVQRLIDGGQEKVSVPLPVVISVAKEINDPRYPSFVGIRKANRAEIPTLSPAELGVDVNSAQTAWTNIRKPEERKTSVQIMQGATAQEKAAKLADALIAEKVI